MPYDARAVANLILEEADSLGLKITHVALQKLLFFAHAHYLVGSGQPMITGFFEAWEHGPVHPGVYNSFKSSGSNAINFRSRKTDIITGEELLFEPIRDLVVIRIVRSVVTNLGHLSPWTLREISHAPKGPWHTVVHRDGSTPTYRLRIPDSVIIEQNRHHKRTVTPGAQTKEFTYEHKEDTSDDGRSKLRGDRSSR